MVFDMITRWLRTSGLKVTHVRNITDIDDKIIKRAAENKEPMDADCALYRCHERGCCGARCDEARVRAARDAIHQGNAGDHRVLEKGPAHAAPDHDVNYSAHFRHGKLRQNARRLNLFESVEITQAKHDPPISCCGNIPPGELAWPSPWAKAARAGISNARRCRAHCWVSISTSRRRAGPAVSAP